MLVKEIFTLLKTKASDTWSVFLISIFLVLFTAAGASADTIGPVISNTYPSDGAVLPYTRVELSATAYDQDYVDSASVVLKINGVKVNPIIQYAPIDESTDDYTTLMIDHWDGFTAGSYNVNLSVKDMKGNITNKSWSFTVGGQATKIASLSPADGNTVNSKLPVITASVSPAAGINPGSIKMTLDGKSVNPAYDAFAGTITYIPSTQLDNEKWYSVSLNMLDVNGNPVSAAWKFYVSIYQEMSYSLDDLSCQKCHDRTKHPMNNCTKCHGTNNDYYNPAYPLDDCYSCHFGTTNYPSGYHTGGIPADNPPDHPVQIIYSCIGCHDKKWSGTVIPSAHQTSNISVQHTTPTTGCTPCHSTSLTREHQPRLDSQGSNFTCYTCHNSPDTKVRTAIKNGDGSCMACHGTGSAHPEHNNGLDQYCQTCHSSSILSDQQAHGKTGCATCHENQTNPTVNYAMGQNDTSCFACHNEGHNVNFVRKVPADIPLYPGFQWSVPQDAALWAGEPWLPAAFNSTGSKLVLSSRKKDVTSPQILDWYSLNLASNRWEKVSAPAGAVQNFTLEYKKGSRLLNVIVYAGASHDPASAYTGYRIELLYK